jgi:tetratricopeptide (TPR) repeat protein
LDERQYEQAIQDFRKFFPDDPALDLVTVDSYDMQKQYGKARAAVDRVDRAVGGDPYLNLLRAQFYFVEKKYDEALQCARKAVAAESDLAPAYWVQVNVSLHKKDFDETTRLLGVLEQDLGIRIGKLTTIPEYADYVKSPQYATWAKRPRK